MWKNVKKGGKEETQGSRFDKGAPSPPVQAVPSSQGRKTLGDLEVQPVPQAVPSRPKPSQLKRREPETVRELGRKGEFLAGREEVFLLRSFVCWTVSEESLRRVGWCLLNKARTFFEESPQL